MRKQAQALSIQTIIIIIIALVVLALVIFFFTTTTGKQLFPSIIQKIRMALGLWNASSTPS